MQKNSAALLTTGRLSRRSLSESDGLPGRCSLPTLLWRRGAGWSVALLLATQLGCGGGGGATSTAPPAPPPVPPTTGSVIPAMAGIVFSELDAQGAVLQQSTPSDASGRFQFARPLSGQRVVSEVRYSHGLAVAARLSAAGQQLTISPLTALFDRLYDSAQPGAPASSGAGALVLAQCGAGAALDMDKALYGNSAASAGASPWMQQALLAYGRALDGLGLAVDAPRTQFDRLLQQHARQLGDYCKLAQQIHEPRWLAELEAALKARLALAETPDRTRLSALRDASTEQVLARLRPRLLVAAHPELKDLMAPRIEALQGQEQRIALDLAVARFASEAPELSASVIQTMPFRRGVRYALDEQGRLLEQFSLAGRSDAAAQAAGLRRLRNVGGMPVEVHLLHDGDRLASMADLIERAMRMPTDDLQEPLTRRVWRFVRDQHVPHASIVAATYAHQPDFYLRSLGTGFCDDAASVQHWLWRALGYEARVYGLDGHVVSEVFRAGRWEMYDAHFGVYYQNRAQQVASVGDLEADSSLVIAPLNPVLASDDFAYSDQMRAFYANAVGNMSMEMYSRASVENFGDTLVIPVGAEVELDVRHAYAMPTVSDEALVPSFPTLKLRLPPGYSGSLPLPLLLADVQGEGQIELLGERTAVTSLGVRPTLLAYYRRERGDELPLRELRVDAAGPAGLTLTFLLSPRRVGPEQLAQLSLGGSNLTGLSLVEGVAPRP